MSSMRLVRAELRRLRKENGALSSSRGILAIEFVLLVTAILPFYGNEYI